MTMTPEDEPEVVSTAYAPDTMAALDDAGIGTVTSAEPVVGEDEATADDDV